MVDHYVPGECERASNVEISQCIRRRYINSVVRSRNAAHADPVGVAKGRRGAQGCAHSDRDCPKQPSWKQIECSLHNVVVSGSTYSLATAKHGTNACDLGIQ